MDDAGTCARCEGSSHIKNLFRQETSARTIRHTVVQLPTKGSVRKAGDEFVVEAEMEGASAGELNRTLLSALRKVEKRTPVRAEWTFDDGFSITS